MTTVMPQRNRYVFPGCLLAIGMLLLVSEAQYGAASRGTVRQLSGDEHHQQHANNNNQQHHNNNNNNQHNNNNNDNQAHPHQNNNNNHHRPLLGPHDPRTVELKTHHTLDATFQEKAKALRDQLSDTEFKAITAFSETLRESHCQRDEGAFQSLNTYVHSQFTLEERVKWMNPVPGVVRSINQESTIPCQATYWVPDGWWQAVPMWSHCCNQGSAIAKCPTVVQETPSACSKAEALQSGHSQCQSDGTLLCPDYVRGSATGDADDDCLAYTFGIADQWDFEDWIGGMGCEVHAHDPTTKYKEIHEAHHAKNVHFHYEGLGIPGDTVTHFRGYGDMGGPMKTLGELWRERGHGDRRISILKIDCEGCEFEAFHQLAVKEPEVISQVCTIIMEVHFSETLQMETAHQLKLMASFWQKYVEEFGFRFWYLHENPGAYFDQRVNPLLLDIGMDPTVCCYEIALRRPGCDANSKSAA